MNRQFGKDQYGPEVATQYLIDFLRKNRDEPFFIYYPMILVHSPFVSTPGSRSPAGNSPQQNFEDMVETMDRLIGRLMTATEELGIARRTVILFAGDNGTHSKIRSTLNGTQIRGGKGRMTDAGTRVPLVALWPDTIPAGQVNGDLIDFADFLPTVLEATGQSIPDGLDGRSFLPQLRGETGNPRSWLHCYYCPRPEKTQPQRFVRDQRWKLYGDGSFFDVREDVLEKRPIRITEPGSAAHTAQTKLKAALNSMPPAGQSLLKFE